MKKLLHLMQCPALVLLSAPAFACTTCDSALAQAVRAEVFGADFWLNAGLTLLPFVIFLGITAAIYYGLPARAWHDQRSHAVRTKGEAM